MSTNDTTSTSTSTNTNPATVTVTVDYTDGAPLAPDDVRSAMARALQAARTVIEQLDDANVANATPCDGWTALDVARHLVSVFHKAGAAPSGADLMAFPEIAEVELDGLVAAVDTAAHAMHAAWSDDATLASMIDAPFGTMPGAAVLGVWSGETLVHTWDLAVSIGIDLNWPEPDTSINLERTMQFLPESGRPENVPFDDAVLLADDAAPIDRLAGWMGRNVSAWR